jgi:bacterioferritin-associated ferredoxin
MIICICNNVSDKTIRASGLTTMPQLCKELGVGAQCGQCVRSAREVLNEQLVPSPEMERRLEVKYL